MWMRWNIELEKPQKSKWEPPARFLPRSRFKRVCVFFLGSERRMKTVSHKRHRWHKPVKLDSSGIHVLLEEKKNELYVGGNARRSMRSTGLFNKRRNKNTALTKLYTLFIAWITECDRNSFKVHVFLSIEYQTLCIVHLIIQQSKVNKTEISCSARVQHWSYISLAKRRWRAKRPITQCEATETKCDCMIFCWWAAFLHLLLFLCGG